MATADGMNPMTSVSLLYFFTFFAFACQGRFLAIFYAEFGLRNDHIGILLATGSFVGLVSTPIWTRVCDHVRGKRTVLLTSIVAASAAIISYTVPWTSLGAALGLLPQTTGLFAWMFVVRCVYSFFFTPVGSILDAIAGETMIGI
jgi:nitrate/nitrite transporter NarK